jgi:putative ABC transport system substrate-binding protein
MLRIRRREFHLLLGGAVVALSLEARAQQTQRMRRVGVLVFGASDDPATQLRVATFAQGLQETGWVIGRNVEIDTRYGADDDRLLAAAKDLVALSPDVILAVASDLSFFNTVRAGNG